MYRQSLKRAISNQYFNHNETTSVMTLDPKVEQEIMDAVKQTEQGAYLALDPEYTQALMTSLREERESWRNWEERRSLLLRRLSVCILKS